MSVFNRNPQKYKFDLTVKAELQGRAFRPAMVGCNISWPQGRSLVAQAGARLNTLTCGEKKKNLNGYKQKISKKITNNKKNFKVLYKKIFTVVDL